MNQISQKNNDVAVRLFSSPTLDTVAMVEEAIKKHSGKFNRTKLWEKLPRKIMWGTYKIVLNYLEDISKIGVAKKNILVYIWNPPHARKLMKMKGIKYEKK